MLLLMFEKEGGVVTDVLALPQDGLATHLGRELVVRQPRCEKGRQLLPSQHGVQDWSMEWSPISLPFSKPAWRHTRAVVSLYGSPAARRGGSFCQRTTEFSVSNAEIPIWSVPHPQWREMQGQGAAVFASPGRSSRGRASCPRQHVSQYGGGQALREEA